LRFLAEGGAIVVFNVSAIRSDAFLVTSDVVCSIHLPLLTSGLVDDLIERFLEAINHDGHRLKQYRDATRKINEVLEKL
jgi:hypothetical protein